MENFFTNYVPPDKKQCLNNYRIINQRVYMKKKDEFGHLPKWESEFPLLKNSEGGMICEVCKKYKQIRIFTMDCSTYKSNSII